MTLSKPKPRKNQVFIGNFIHTKKLGELEYLPNTAVCVDASGIIVVIDTNYNQQKAVETLYAGLGWGLDDVAVTVARDSRQFFFPGFIDTHVHASQYPNIGLFGKSTLMDWLDKYTFPMEASLSDLSKARAVYTRCIRRTLAHGTTTAAYYATIDVDATNLLADLCHSMGQRAFVGRVCMDRLGPDYYVDESPDAALAATRATIEHIRGLAGDSAGGSALVTPILTPRFAPACTADTLGRLSALQKETQLPMQTHISENADEVALVRTLFPDCRGYADVYDAHGVLNDKMVLAHAVHLTEAEADLVAERGAAVAHCPVSNAALTSGVAPVRRLLARGIRVGLGSDMSGGYSPSILEAARHAKLASNYLAAPGGPLDGLPRDERDAARLSVEDVLYLATRGGADVLGLADKVGVFEVGMQWDAQLVDLGAVLDDSAADGNANDSDDINAHGNVDVFGWETWDERLAKWVFNGDDRNTKKVWVQGRLVHEQR